MDREAMGDEERATRLEVGRDVLGIDRAVAHVRREQGDQSGFLRCLGRRDDAKAVRLRLALGPAAGPGADDHVEAAVPQVAGLGASLRSEEHTSELQSLMHIPYAVFG